jgi:hypothetical protein
MSAARRPAVHEINTPNGTMGFPGCLFVRTLPPIVRPFARQSPDKGC